MEALIAAAIKYGVQAYSKWGLAGEAAARVGVIFALADAFGQPHATIISGRRDAAKQRCLLENWQAGYQKNKSCSMPVAKPANPSYHLNGLAVDVRRQAPGYDFFRSLWLAMPYGQNPSNDPNHFEIDNPLIPPGRF